VVVPRGFPTPVRLFFATMLGRLAAVAALVLATPRAADAGLPVRCDNLSTSDLAVDGLLDDWGRQVVARAGTASDGLVELRCSWDGTALAFALDFKDDRVVRVRGAGHDDRVDISIAVPGGGRPSLASVMPGNAIAKAKIVKPARVAVADSLQPKGFSIEVRVPVAALAGFSPSTPAIELSIVFHDSDRATGGDTTDITLAATIELGDRKELLDDFLRTVKLKRADVRLDTLVELDPDRRGKERIVAGGTVIGVLTDQYAFVSLPISKPADVKKLELIPLGTRGQQIVSALVRQSGNGGSRDLLMLWTVWSGQLEPLVSIEVRKELGTNVLEAGWKLVKGRGKRAPELWVESKPAVGFTAETFNEISASDADPIVVPWDAKRGGVAYSLTGKSIARRDLPLPKNKR
jgi:hypothetical protein